MKMLPRAVCRVSRRGVTLIEMLVALAITLVMMGAVISVFGLIGNNVAGNRSLIEMAERTRAVRNRLQLDLAGATAPMLLPPLRPEADAGYFEYIEGPMNDSIGNPNTPVYGMTGNPNTPGYGFGVLGDVDDVLACTVRSSGEPFVGMSPAGLVQSQVAEVIWFVAPNPDVPTIVAGTASTTLPNYTLYRRTLLVAPTVDMSGVAPANFWMYDISAHPNPSQTAMIANTLGDLTKRENRYGHFPISGAAAVFPYPAYLPYVGFPIGNPRHGDDVVLTNVLAFDVKVFDPIAAVQLPASGSPVALAPGDPGYGAAGNTTITPPPGAFVDLNYSSYAIPPTPSYFSAANNTKSGLTVPTFDTWSLSYEANGPGTNGLDDNGDGVVDDPGEYITSPPYPIPAPLRGVQIKIRCYEPDSRQVREVTVEQDFLPNN